MALRRGDMAIMGNLGSDRVAGVQEAIEAAGAQLLYPPRRSPELNPVEYVFANSRQSFAPNTRILEYPCGQCEK